MLRFFLNQRIDIISDITNGVGSTKVCLRFFFSACFVPKLVSFARWVLQQSLPNNPSVHLTYRPSRSLFGMNSKLLLLFFTLCISVGARGYDERSFVDLHKPLELEEGNL